MDGLGLESKKWLETGLAGIIKGKDAQKTVAFRADIDALMSKDGTLKHLLETGLAGIIKGKDAQKTVAFRADIDGLMSKDGTVKHLCGHDGHMSILLGLIKYVNDNKDKLKDNFVFIFQPAGRNS